LGKNHQKRSGRFGILTTLCLLTFIAIGSSAYIFREHLIELVRQPDLLEYPEAKRCSECHQSIYEAWKESRHSIAWKSKTYIEATKNRSKEKCLPCHIPEEVKAGIKPVPRDKNREDGIYCVPCHVIENKMNGPYDLFSPPHPTVQNPEYRKSKICGSCHEKTYKEWVSSSSQKTCQECHMPRLKKRLVQKFPLELLHSKKMVGDHRFIHGEITNQDLLVSGKIEGNQLNVSLLNRLIPHMLPTATSGDPRLFLYIRFFDRAGKEIEKYKEIFAPQQETALPFGEKIFLTYKPTMDTSRIEILLQYKSSWSKEKKVIRHIKLTL
jgi:hypothetical protein